MKALGASAYRFSMTWRRIFPDGTGIRTGHGAAPLDEMRAWEVVGSYETSGRYWSARMAFAVQPGSLENIT